MDVEISGSLMLDINRENQEPEASSCTGAGSIGTDLGGDFLDVFLTYIHVVADCTLAGAGAGICMRPAGGLARLVLRR